MFDRAPAVVRDESGTSLVEYALIVSLIAMTCLFGIRVLGTNANAMLTTAADSISTTATPPSTEHDHKKPRY